MSGPIASGDVSAIAWGSAAILGLGLAEAAKRGWEVDPHTGAELEALAKDVINQPKDVIERMKWVLGN